jgi:hypothetical protein
MHPLRYLSLFFGTLLMGVGASACAAPPHVGHGASGRAAYQYVYYPEYQLYFAPDRHIWFWPSGGSWHSGAHLPRIYRPHVRHGGVTVHLYDRFPRGHAHGAHLRGVDRYGAWHGKGYHPRQHGWKGQQLHGWKDGKPWRHDSHQSRHENDPRWQEGRSERHPRHGDGRKDRRGN